MHIGFIGNGPVATNLAALFRAQGHTTTLSGRSGPQTFASAIMGSDVVVLAIPFRACAVVLPPLRDALRAKTVIDATNPLAEDYGPLVIDGGRSAAEEIADLLPESTVVKAFNTVFADNMSTAKLERGERPVVTIVCADDAPARGYVAALAQGAGFDAIEAPTLACARYVEAMTHLNIALAFGMQRGTSGAFLYAP